MDFIVENNKVYRYLNQSWIYVGELKKGMTLAEFKMKYFK